MRFQRAFWIILQIFRSGLFLVGDAFDVGFETPFPSKGLSNIENIVAEFVQTVKLKMQGSLEPPCTGHPERCFWMVHGVHAVHGPKGTGPFLKSTTGSCSSAGMWRTGSTVMASSSWKSSRRRRPSSWRTEKDTDDEHREPWGTAFFERTPSDRFLKRISTVVSDLEVFSGVQAGRHRVSQTQPPLGDQSMQVMR